jgi:hypothetical protein
MEGRGTGYSARRRSPRSSALALAFLLSTSFATAALAAPLRGVIKLPKKVLQNSGLGGGAYWPGLPNGLLPINAPIDDPRRKMLVFVEGSGLSKQLTIPPTVRMIDAGFAPAVVAVRPGTRVAFVNRDWMLHLLEPSAGKFMASQSINPGETVKHTFSSEGVFRLHCSEVPHMKLTVWVTSAAGQLALIGTNGTFSFSNIPQGTYTLKVWHEGAWVHSQPITVRKKNNVLDVTLRKLNTSAKPAAPKTESAPSKKKAGE